MTVAKAYDYESIALTNAAASGLTAAKLEGGGDPAERVLVTVETGQVRYRYDSTAPTTSEGHLAEAGNTLSIEGTEDLRRFKAIATGAGGATLKVTYERE